ncbi:MAG: PAS domain-containing protein [Litorilinea sp.]
MEFSVRILIIEDSAILRQIYRHLLTQAGYTVMEAETGAAGLRIVDTDAPDILLLDRVLPDMDGSDIVARVKSDPATAEIYVIMVSGLKTTEDDRVSGLEAGADDYVVKPVGKRELLARVQVAVRLRTANLHLRAANLRLQASEMQFRTLAENSPDYIARVERDGQIRYLNPAAQRMFQADGGAGADARGFVRHLTDDGELSQQVRAVFATGHSCRIKSVLRWQNEVHHLDTRLVPEFDHAGQVNSILAVTRDYTDFVLAEQEGRRLATVIQQSVDAVQITDAAGRIIYVNAAYEQLTGLQAAQVMGLELPGMDYTCPEHEDCRLLEHLKTDAERWQGLVAVKPSGREPRELDTTVFPIRDSQGKTTNYAALQRDVTERRQSEHEREVIIRVAAALRAALSRREVLDATLDQVMLLTHVMGVAYTAIDYREAGSGAPLDVTQPDSQSGKPVIEIGNRQIANLNRTRWQNQMEADPDREVDGQPADTKEGAREIPQQVMVECMRPQDRTMLGTVYPISLATIRRILAARTLVIESREWAGDLGFDTKWPAGVKWVVGVALHVRNHMDGVLWIGTSIPISERMSNLLGSVVDMLISSLERAELYEATWRYADELEQRVNDRTQELAAANEQLRELDRLKSKFVSNVSHELRTPIASLKLYLNLLERGKEAKREQYQAMLRQSADRLGQLVQDILSLSRLEIAQLQPRDFAPTDLNSVVTQVVQHLQPQAEAVGLVLAFKPCPNLPLIIGDFNQLSQLVTNLVGNALTYTQQGTVCVETIQQLEGEDTPPCVHLVVKDSGAGIHPEDLPHVFDRFYRGTYMQDQDIPGTGLGLAIVKEIVHMHQGQIDLTSELGNGTTIDVELPFLDFGPGM